MINENIDLDQFNDNLNFKHKQFNTPFKRIYLKVTKTSIKN